MTEPIEKSVDRFLRNHISAEAGNKLLLACSGGVDSMVLAYILVKQNYAPALAHVNFQLRGIFSDEDEKFVKNWAKTYDLPFFTKAFDTEHYVKTHGISTQMAARDLRYNYFEELMREHELERVLTAQHADDSLETILINLSRGSSLGALAGIRPIQKNILRPLWQQTKAEIITYAKKNGIEWREDLSNARDNYQRNFIRLHVLPPLKNAFPNFDNSFRKTLEHANEDRKLLEELLSEKLKAIVQTEKGQQKLSLGSISGIESKGSLLQFWLREKGKFDIEAILNSLQSESGRQFESETHELLLGRGELILRPKKKLSDQKYFINKTYKSISHPIELNFNVVSASDFQISGDLRKAALDFEKLSFPLTLRKWQAGDSFVPLGMKGSKKLSDFFIDEKMNRYEKEDIYVLCSGEDIAWIIGKRIDDRFKVTDKTKTIYFARLINLTR